MAGKHLEEGAERLAKRGVHAAGIDQRAIGGVVLEAFRHREIVLRHAHHVEEGDVGRGLGEPDAAIAAAHGFDEPVFDERLENLEQEQFGDVIGAGDFRNVAELAVVRLAIHQDTDRVVGLPCQSHSAPFRACVACHGHHRLFRIVIK